MLVGVLMAAAPLGAQAPATQSQPEPIQDNSFLIEEAYNQPDRVVQHINTFQRPQGGGAWAYSFTQEWPVRGRFHQMSVTVPVQHFGSGAAGQTGVGDVLLNYRAQIAGVSGGPVLFAPRATLVLPTGDVDKGMGSGAVGAQVNLPLSIEIGERVVTHANVGATYTPGARNAAGASAATEAYSLGQSLIWMVRPSLNLMVEAAWASVETVAAADRTESARSLVVAPGVRYAHNLASGMQIVPGAAYVIGAGPSRGERSVFTYLSIEHAF